MESGVFGAHQNYPRSQNLPILCLTACVCRLSETTSEVHNSQWHIPPQGGLPTGRYQTSERKEGCIAKTVGVHGTASLILCVTHASGRPKVLNRYVVCVNSNNMI